MCGLPKKPTVLKVIWWKNDPSNVIGESTKNRMFFFGEVIGYIFFFSVTKIFHKLVLVKKWSLECYWWKNDSSNVISEKTIPWMLLVIGQKNSWFFLVRLLDTWYFLVEQNIPQMVISEKKIPRMLLVKKQCLECYWWIYDPSIVIGE